MKISAKAVSFLAPSLFVGLFACASIAAAATTIGTNINTAGTLLVTGHSALGLQGALNGGTVNGIVDGPSNPTVLGISENSSNPTLDPDGGWGLIGINSTVNTTVNDPNGSMSLGLSNISNPSVSGSILEMDGSMGAILHQGTGALDHAFGYGSFIGNTSSGSMNDPKNFYGNLDNEAGGSVTTSRIFQAQVENDAGGSITNGYAFEGGIENFGAGSITTGIGMLIDSPANSGGGTISTLYGLKIDDQTGTGITNSWAIKTGTGKIEFGDVVQSDATAFASLPACGGSSEGSMRAINNSTTNVWGATITGGGSNHVLAYCDGTNWTVMAK